MPRLPSPSTTRRTFLTSAFALATAGRLSAASAASSSRVPEVDSLAIHVIVDNATFGPFLPDVSEPGLRVERNTSHAEPRMSRQPLMAEFGLSLLATSRRGEEEREVLVDFGYSPEVFTNNMARIATINTADLDAAVLSHGHLDHYGGFAAVIGDSPDIPKDWFVPLYVGGEETFCERLAIIGNPPPVMGRLDRAALRKVHFEVKIAPKPTLVADHAFTTGVIPLETFERAAIPTQMRPGVGCDVDGLSAAKQHEKQLADDGEHELATFYNVKGLGLVVIASCSHRGVLNSVKRAQAISGVEKVHAVVGGFHLVRPRTEDEARRTVVELQKINPTYIVPMHCTGEVFIAEALRLMPEKVIRVYVGNRLTFTAA